MAPRKSTRGKAPREQLATKDSLYWLTTISRIDAKYIAPTGKKLRTLNEIAVFTEANLKYKDVKLSDFSFTSPKVMEDTIPEDVN
uniref:MBD domain-containing protein n=1 Tax=Salix viminalis TaxID=40686 RepID=A0A6N2JVW9_SALVM